MTLERKKICHVKMTTIQIWRFLCFSFSGWISRFCVALYGKLMVVNLETRQCLETVALRKPVFVFLCSINITNSVLKCCESEIPPADEFSERAFDLSYFIPFRL